MEPLLAVNLRIKKDRTLTQYAVQALLIDVTEQPIQRPKKYKNRKKYYSGKKKSHTQKVELIMKSNGEIVNISKTYPGKMHDFRIRHANNPLPLYPNKFVDLGYLGLNHLLNPMLLPVFVNSSAVFTSIYFLPNKY